MTNQAYYPQGPGPSGYGYDDPTETDASFLLTVVPGDQMLALSWPAQQGSLWYDVYCGANPEAMVRVAKNIPATSFIIWNLAVGRPYYCQVIARYPDVRAGINTETVVGIPQPYLPQLAPVLSATTDGTLMYLSWNAPPGTSYYSINVGTKSGQEQVYLTGYRQTTLQVPNFNNGGNYFFNVTAYNISGAAATSNEVSVQSVATPAISPGAGKYTTPQQISIASATAGATIHYTTDGSVPNQLSPIYGAPFTIGAGAPATVETVSAIATASGFLNSQIASAAYNIQQLVGLNWQLPCLSDPSGGNCQCATSTTNQITLQAAAGTRWNITFRIRGVIETKNYSGGTNDGQFWQVGGSPVSDASNWYELSISSPPQVYYINRTWGSFPPPTGGGTTPYAVDYQKTFEVDAGATITMTTSSGTDNRELSNIGNAQATNDNPAFPIVVNQPYNGQFAQIDAVQIVQL